MNTQDKKVLIVEDDMLLTIVKERMVKVLGYQVVGTAASAEEAIEKAREKHPDILLVDINLNGNKDGIDAVREINKDAKHAVIYLSGSNDTKTMRRASQTGFVDFLLKPTSKGDLEKSLELAANSSSQSAPAA